MLWKGNYEELTRFVISYSNLCMKIIWKGNYEELTRDKCIPETLPNIVRWKGNYEELTQVNELRIVHNTRIVIKSKSRGKVIKRNC